MDEEKDCCDRCGQEKSPEELAWICDQMVCEQCLPEEWRVTF